MIPHNKGVGFQWRKEEGHNNEGVGLVDEVGDSGMGKNMGT